MNMPLDRVQGQVRYTVRILADVQYVYTIYDSLPFLFGIQHIPSHSNVLAIVPTVCTVRYRVSCRRCTRKTLRRRSLPFTTCDKFEFHWLFGSPISFQEWCR